MKKIYFIWHWKKKTDDKLKGVFAVFDSLLYAIQKLSKDFDVQIICISDVNHGYFFSEEQKIKYYFVKDKAELFDYLKKNSPDVIFLNHHSQKYKDVLKEIEKLNCLKMIYYSSPIKFFDNNIKNIFRNIFKSTISKNHKNINYHFVHHDYQKRQLKKILNLQDKNIIIAPKTADLNIYKPLKIEKKWDCVYAGRSTEGYWKRPELAIEACALSKKTLTMPGAKLKKEYPHVTVFDHWLEACELNNIFNQSKCFIITSDEFEMGPRVIPEAAACNIPIICCSDSPACVSHIKKIGGFIAEPNFKDISEKIDLATKTICNSREQLISLGYTYDLIYNKILEIIRYEFN